MTPAVAASPIVPSLDEPTALLVRLSGAIAGGSEADVRANATACTQGVDPVWVEEVILQSYLFAGLPRTLNAMREWRRLSTCWKPRRREDCRAFKSQKGTGDNPGEVCETLFIHLRVGRRVSRLGL